MARFLVETGHVFITMQRFKWRCQKVRRNAKQYLNDNKCFYFLLFKNTDILGKKLNYKKM